MIRLETTSLLFTTLLLAVACGSGGTERRRVGGSNFGGSTVASQNNVAATGKNDGLASYLFTLKAAEQISPLVMSFKQSSTKEQDATQDSSLNAQRDFISETLNDMMDLKAHNPGRDFKVTVTSDTVPNASALNQSVVVNKGIIDFASNLSLAMVLCHEVAHSTRNHSSRAEAQIQDYENKNKTKSDKLDKTVAELVAANYDKSKKIFSHKNSDYVKVKPIWDDFWNGFVTFQKRFESEADVVGGRICANAGFSTAEVEEGFTSLFKQFASGTTVPKNTADKDYTVEESEIGELLHEIYGTDTHPTDAERTEQIERVKTVFVQGTDKTIADRWKKDFPGKPGLTLVPFHLMSGKVAFKHRSPLDNVMIRHTQSSIGQ
jgi:Zn-dependent protease with chaperone function